MRLLRPLSIAACLTGLAACDEPSEATDTTSSEHVGFDDTFDAGDELEYFAIIVDDSVEFPEHRADGGDPCATSGSGAHGADIDALELEKDGIVFTAFSVNYQPGPDCDIADAHDNLEDVKGAPDGTLNDGYVSLGGGSVTVTFDSSRVAIEPGDSVTVYEIGDTFCTGIQGCVGDEAYSVFLATELTCEKDTDGCEVIALAEQAGGEATIEIPSF